MIPLAVVMVMSIYALIIQLGTFYADQNWLLLVLDVIILIASLWVALEAFIAMGKARGGVDDDADKPVASVEG
jgi:carbon starvation protein